MLLSQTDVAVDEELEKVIITIYSSTETDIGDESGYEYSPEKLQKPPVKQRRVYSLNFECILFRMLKFSWNYIDLNEIRCQKSNKIIIEYKTQKCNLRLNRKKNIKDKQIQQFDM